MALREIDERAGPPWDRELHGELHRHVVRSELLARNPLGDPDRRPLYVYRSPGVRAGRAREVSSVYVIQGYSGQVDTWTARAPFAPTMIERLDAMFAGDPGVPEAVVVFVDAWTSVGGSQFLNSSGTGPYMDYLCDEVVAFVDERHPTAASRDRRGLAGKSSGGYGAMVVPMLRPDVFGALASHAGDALFECAYAPSFPAVVRQLRDNFDGSYERLLAAAKDADPFVWNRFNPAFETYAYALAYSPDPDRPGRAQLPFDTRTAALVPDVWQRWLERDPVRMAPRHADALRSMRLILLEAGRSDEYYLDLGARAFADELESLGVEHALELFDGGHGGMTHRYPGAIRALLLALAA